MQVTKGYSNWKDATVAFNKHEGSNCHREAVEVICHSTGHHGAYWCAAFTGVCERDGKQP